MVDGTPKIVGTGWEIWLNEDCYLWEFSGEGAEIAKMLSGGFPSERIYESYRNCHTTVWGTTFGSPYEDALAFLHEWGVKCEGADLPKLDGETGPMD